MLLGVFLLFNNLGFFSYHTYHVVISWQMLLIAIGAVLVFDENPKNRPAGAILVLIGFIFIAPRIFDFSISRLLIPSLVIVGGIWFIIRSTTRRGQNDVSASERRSFGNFEETSFQENPVGDQKWIKREYVFSGSKERWSNGKIRNLEINATFSGIELDLIDAELDPEVDQVHIKVMSVFSGVTLYIPGNWNVVVHKTGVFGGFTDRRPVRSLPLGGKVVIMELEAVFGGGELKYYE